VIPPPNPARDAWIEQQLAKAPPPTTAQLSRIAVLLRTDPPVNQPQHRRPAA